VSSNTDSVDPHIAGRGEAFPSLPLGEWDDTKDTLHRFVQIVGKIRLVSTPFRNHWWHVPLYVTARGLTTTPMRQGEITFSIDFDFLVHRLIIETDAGAIETFGLERLSVAQFYEQVFSRLSGLGIDVRILNRPYELTPAEPFGTDTAHASYDREYVHRWWRILVQADMVFKEFSGRFLGKTSPVHLFWHSLDLALTRFSGRRAPVRPGTDRVTHEAYSHEVISFGFWPGDQNVHAPAYYSYTAPEPPGLPEQPLQPSQAYWGTVRGSAMALLMHEELRTLDSPSAALLEFLESAYQAGASTAGWDRADFAAERPG
jgi:hypothetical protein